MPLHFPTFRLPTVSLPSLAEIRARFTAFTGKIFSALQSLGRSEPVIKPLHTRQVAIATTPPTPILPALLQPPPSEAEAKQRLAQDGHRQKQSALNDEIAQFAATKLKPTSTPEKSPAVDLAKANSLAELNQEIAEGWHESFQGDLNEAISGFDPTRLKHVTPREKDGLAFAKLEFQLNEPQDNVALRPAPLNTPKEPAKLLGEPTFADVKDDLASSFGQADFKTFSQDLGPRLKKIVGLKPGTELTQLASDLTALAEELGETIGKLYAQLPADAQDAFAIKTGDTFKAELWQFLRTADKSLPELKMSFDEDGYRINTDSPAEIFLDRVYNHAATQLDIHLGPGDKPTLTVHGSVYQQTKLLGQGGGGMVFLYENKEGDRLAVKSKGFGKDAESLVTAAERKALSSEFDIHHGLMGADGEGHKHLLVFEGGARTVTGQPVGILKLAPRGDVTKLLGTSANDGVFAEAEKKGLVSPQAMNLVKLLVLHDSIEGMAYLQEQMGSFHHDFKPANLFIGDDARVKVADFGLAHPGLSQPKAHGSEGTPDYLPPEAYIKSTDSVITAKADTWAIGIMAHQLFRGSVPFSASFANVKEELLTAYSEGDADGARRVLTKLSANHDRRAEVQGVTALDRLINALLHPDPAKRPSLSAVLSSSAFDDLGSPAFRAAVRELLMALTAVPQDPALIKVKSDALGI